MEKERQTPGGGKITSGAAPRTTKIQIEPGRAAPAVTGRVVVTTTVTHVVPRATPTTISVGHTRLLQSDEAPYRQPASSLRVGGSWVPIPLGWLATQPDHEASGCSAAAQPNVSEVVLYNTEGTLLSQIPTQEERDAFARRVVEVGFCRAGRSANATAWDPPGMDPPDAPDLFIPPGDVLRVLPCNAAAIMIRCADPTQQARVELIVIPR